MTSTALLQTLSIRVINAHEPQRLGRDRGSRNLLGQHPSLQKDRKERWEKQPAGPVDQRSCATMLTTT